MKTVLITPPFVQPNSPYPSTLNLTSFLRSQGFKVSQSDLSLHTLLKIFSRSGLAEIFDRVEKMPSLSPESRRILSLRGTYETVIGTVISFLQGKNRNVAYRLISDNFLPKGPLFEQAGTASDLLGRIDITDKAKYYASLMIDELVFFIRDTVSPHFGFSRYGEKIAQSAQRFAVIEHHLDSGNGIIEELILATARELWHEEKPDIIGISVPFPGNFPAALLLSRSFKKFNPAGKVIMGGGYINTELRNIKEKKLFDYIDYLTLDDGEMPLLQILKKLHSPDNNEGLVRTFMRVKNKIICVNDHPVKNIPHNSLPAPSTDGIFPEQYISMTEMLNPMHRLWSDGYWHKLTAAHGCYWHKCTFCDTSLDYIKRFDPATAETVVDHMESLISRTGISSFHFTDEAAPPQLLKRIAVEILKRDLNVTWWGNIRFDGAFTPDLCCLLSASGCIAVSGGIEAADRRVLKKINKGITVEQAAAVCRNFQDAGIMVHAYLMYGFPGETAQETVNSLETVRQFFAAGLLNSAFWHLFSLTVHSPIAAEPEKFGVKILSPTDNPFANNDLQHLDRSGTEHHKFSPGLRKAIYNYMHGVGIDLPVVKWFDFKVPKPRIAPDHILKTLAKTEKDRELYRNRTVFPRFSLRTEKIKKETALTVHTPEAEGKWVMSPEKARWLERMLRASVPGNELPFLEEWDKNFPESKEKFSDFLRSQTWKELRELGLLLIK